MVPSRVVEFVQGPLDGKLMLVELTNTAMLEQAVAKVAAMDR